VSRAFAVSRSTAEPLDPQWDHAVCVLVTRPVRGPQQFAILTTMHPGVHSRVKREFGLARWRRPLQVVSGCALLMVAVYYVRAFATQLEAMSKPITSEFGRRQLRPRVLRPANSSGLSTGPLRSSLPAGRRVLPLDRQFEVKAFGSLKARDHVE